MKSLSLYDWLYLCITWIVFSFSIYMYVPCVDDCRYAFNSVTGKPISSFFDILQSNYQDFLYVNGRIIVHIIVQFFCGFHLVGLFSIISGLMYVFLHVGCLLIINKFVSFGTRNLGLPIISLLLFLMIPSWGLSFGGNIAFVVNYLWSCTIYVWWLYCWLSINLFSNKWKLLGVYCLSIMAGLWSEAFALGFVVACLIRIMFEYKSITKNEWVFILFFIVGTVIHLIAPGNYVKMNNGNEVCLSVITIIRHIGKRIIPMLKITPIWVMTLFCVLLLFFNKGREFLRTTYRIWLPAYVMVIFAILISYRGWHQLTIAGLSCVLLILPLIFTLMNHCKSGLIWVTVAVNFIVFGLWGGIIHYRYKLYGVNKELMENMLDGNETSNSYAFEYYDRKIMANNFFRRYVNLYQGSLNYSNTYFHHSLGRYLAVHNRGAVVSMMALPLSKQEIVCCCAEHNVSAEGVVRIDELAMHIIVLPEQVECSKVSIIEVVSSAAWIDKMVDFLFGRKIKTIIKSFGKDWNVALEDVRWFVEGNQRYILLENPTNKVLQSVKVYVE